MTIPRFVAIWSDGSPEREAAANGVERVVDLWYAHGAVLPKPDSLARRSPAAGPSIETQAWLYVEGNVAPSLLHALTGVLSAENRHPVTEALAFTALDVLAEFHREGHGFVGIRPRRKNEDVDAEGQPNRNEAATTSYGEWVERGVIEPRYVDRVRGGIASELGLGKPSSKRKPEPEEERQVFVEGAQTAHERKKGWNGGKKIHHDGGKG